LEKTPCGFESRRPHQNIHEGGDNYITFYLPPLSSEFSWLLPGALAVVEESANARFTLPADFEELERRRYDDTEFIILRSCKLAP
jgi:hypothetical protein